MLLLGLKFTAPYAAKNVWRQKYWQLLLQLRKFFTRSFKRGNLPYFFTAKVFLLYGIYIQGFQTQ